MHDLLDWARGAGLEIVLVLLGAVLVSRGFAAVGRVASGRMKV